MNIRQNCYYKERHYNASRANPSRITIINTYTYKRIAQENIKQKLTDWREKSVIQYSTLSNG